MEYVLVPKSFVDDAEKLADGCYGDIFTDARECEKEVGRVGKYAGRVYKAIDKLKKKPIVPTVGVYVEGGCVQNARASLPMTFILDDDDNFEATNPDTEEYERHVESRAEYQALPVGIF